MSRRLVVVLFLDLVGWTKLAERVDPEPLQSLLEDYYDICCAAVEEHGGVVEKFIGDAVMAVFGATTSQEDDAMRALRTAFQIRTDVGRLRAPGGLALPVEVHCGIAAGEALVTHSARAGIRVVGDVVNLAARLQSVAVAGEIVVNQVVGHLARSYVTMTELAPLTLKGKAEPVPALLVTGPPGTVHQPNDGSPMVNRGTERARLREAYDRVVRDRRCGVVAVLGPPGIGKSRLVRAAVHDLGDAVDGPTAVFGNCPSYGPNTNYTVLVQVLDELTSQAAPSRELMRADSHLAAVLASLRDASASRRDSTVAGPGVEEVSWAARELLATATDRPLVVVWDSLEWAAPSLLRLIGELVDSLRDLPLLMICVARPELTDLDVGWMGSGGDPEVIDVGALTPADSAELATALATSAEDGEVLSHDLGLVDRISIYSAGNPLFIRLMVESAVPGRAPEEAPATITAMVGAMLDRLPAPARQLLGAASVIGLTFTMEQFALLDTTLPVTEIGALLQRRLVRASTNADEYHFVQQPVHEVAYGRLEKEQRYSWHRRLAEHDVSPAFHFEAAVRLLVDLRPDDADLPPLSRLAADELLREGTAALRQRDITAAIGLLERALDLVAGGADGALSVAAIRLSDALLLAGDSQRAVDALVRAAGRFPNDPVPRPCLIQKHLLSVRLGHVPEVTYEDLLAELAGNPHDRLAWCRFEQLRMLLHLRHGQFGAAERAASAALEHARAISDAYEQDRMLAALCEVRQWSPTPVVDKLAGCAELIRRFAGDRFLLVPVLAARARCLALTGDPAGARSALAEAGAAVEQLRLTLGQVVVDQAGGLACSVAGDHVDAERHFRAAADALGQAGYVPLALTLRVQAARERARAHPTDQTMKEVATEIAGLLERCDEMDVRGRLLCASAAVRLAATEGRSDPMLGEVLRLLDTTDDPCLRGEVFFDLAQAHRDLGRHDDANLMAASAIDCYTAVGATQPVRTVRTWTRT